MLATFAADCGAFSLWWTELSIIVCFALGYMLLRSRQPEQKATRVKPCPAGEATAATCAAIISQAAAGNNQVAVKLWRASKAYIPTDFDTLSAVAHALFELDPIAMVDEVVEYMELHDKVLNCPAAAAVVLEVPARAGDTALMEELLAEMEDRLQLEVTYQVDEVLLQGYSSAGSTQSVQDCMDRIRTAGRKVTSRGHSIAIRALLNRGLVEAAAERAVEMQHDGFTVPPAAAAELLRAACKAGCAAPVFERLKQELRFPPDSVEVLLQHCARHSDVALAQSVHVHASENKVPLTLAARTAWLKIHGMASGH